MSEEYEYKQPFYDLIQDLRLAKLTENVAKKKRTALEERIAGFIKSPETGQKTIRAVSDEGQVLTVTIKRGLNYRADVQAIDKYFADESPSLGNEFAAVPCKSKATRELDVAGYEWYRKYSPDIFAEIAKHVTITPKKPSIAIKVVE